MAGKIALDTSAMMALLQGEPGAQIVQDVLESEQDILVSSVNLCELATRLTSVRETPAEVAASLDPFIPYLVEFDLEQAVRAAELTRITRPLGLSLGDRACLALALTRGAVALTSDRAWKKLKVGVEVRLLR